MYLYNLQTKQQTHSFEEPALFALLTQEEIHHLPFHSQDLMTLLEDNPRPVLHHNHATIYSFRIYQKDLKSIKVTLITQEKHFYIITEAPQLIKKELPNFIEDDNFISALIKYFLDEFYTVFSDYEDKLIELEHSLSSGSFTNVSLDSLSEMKHDAMMAEKNMRRIQYITINVLEKNKDLAHLHALVVNDSDYARHLVDYINHLITLYNSLIAEKTNSTINKLTVLAFLATPVSMLSGIYGMNFINMPGIYNENGFYIIMGLTFISMWLIYIIIRKYMTKK